MIVTTFWQVFIQALYWTEYQAVSAFWKNVIRALSTSINCIIIYLLFYRHGGVQNTSYRGQEKDMNWIRLKKLKKQSCYYNTLYISFVLNEILKMILNSFEDNDGNIRDDNESSKCF